MRAVAALLLALTSALTACSGDGSDQSPPKADPRASCLELDRKMLNRVAEGLIEPGSKVLAGYAVPLDEAAGNYGFAAAVRVSTIEDGSGVVVLGLGSPFEGPITVTEEVGRRVFTWGTAAQPGSPMSDVQLDIAVSDAAEEAAACLG